MLDQYVKQVRLLLSVTAGTIMHDSHLPLRKWFAAVYLMCESKKGASDLPPRAVPHPMLVPAPVEGREGRASSGTRATA